MPTSYRPAAPPTLLLLALVTGLAAGAGCGKTVYRAYEGQFCSSNGDDDPFHECSPSQDLICIHTYRMTITEGPNIGGSVPIWLCRLGCDPNKPRPCAASDEICCPGPTYGRNYDFTHACMKTQFCDNLPPVDARPDSSREAGPEAGGSDAGVGDAGGEAGGDAPADAPIPLDGADAAPDAAQEG